MDLVSLETQQENDFFAEYLESSKAVVYTTVLY